MLRILHALLKLIFVKTDNIEVIERLFLRQ